MQLLLLLFALLRKQARLKWVSLFEPVRMKMHFGKVLNKNVTHTKNKNKSLENIENKNAP